MDPQDEVKELLEESQTEENQIEETQVDEPEEEEKQEEVKPPKKTFEERKKEIAKQTWEMREAERKAKAIFGRVQKREALLVELEEKLRKRLKDNGFENIEFEDSPEVKPTQRSEEEIVKDYLSRQKEETMMKNWGLAREEAIMDDPKFETKESRIAETLQNYNNTDVVKAILESDKSIGLINYLNDNINELDRIAQLSPFGAAKELGKIEIKLGEYKAPKTTSAPPPLKTVKGSGAPSRSISEMSWDEFCREQNRKEFGR